jgi:hypothetical protein
MDEKRLRCAAQDLEREGGEISGSGFIRGPSSLALIGIAAVSRILSGPPDARTRI